MKRITIPAVLVFCFVLLSSSAHAVSTEHDSTQERQRQTYGITELEQALPEEAYEIWGSLHIDETLDPDELLQTLLSSIRQGLSETLHGSLRNVCQVMLICFVTAALQTLPYKNGAAEITGISGAMSASVLGAVQACSCIPQGVRILSVLSVFSGKILPAMCAAATAGGAITSAGAKYAISALALNLYGKLAAEVLLPALCLFAAASLTAAVLQNEMLLSVVQLLKKLLKILLIGTSMIFTAYLALTGILKGSVDASAVKAAKAVLSSALPVVGGILSDVSDSLASGAAILCAGAGFLGILCVLAVCIVPYLSIGLHYLLFQCMSAFASAISDKRMAMVLKGLSDVYAMLLGITGTVSIILFVSIISLMRAVT